MSECGGISGTEESSRSGTDWGHRGQFTDKGVGSPMYEFLTMKKASDLKPYCLSSGDSSLSSDRLALSHLDHYSRIMLAGRDDQSSY